MRATNSLDPLRAKLARVGGLAEIDTAALISLPFAVRPVAADRYVVRQDDPVSTFSVLLSGFAYRSRILRDGSRQIVSIHLPGDIFDLGALVTGTSVANLQMLTTGEIASVPSGALASLLRDAPRLQGAIWKAAAREAAISVEWMASLGRRNAQRRIAHLLCEFAFRLAEAGISPVEQAELPMTQAQLADATGLTAVHVNRVLQRLRAQGILGPRGRGVAIADWSRLAALAQFDPGYLEDLDSSDPRSAPARLN